MKNDNNTLIEIEFTDGSTEEIDLSGFPNAIQFVDRIDFNRNPEADKSDWAYTADMGESISEGADSLQELFESLEIVVTDENFDERVLSPMEKEYADFSFGDEDFQVAEFTVPAEWSESQRKFAAWIIQAGESVRVYSGRGMFGSTCPGVDTCWDDERFSKVTSGIRSDDMGMDAIYYLP